jgi:formamidopyrimidine-DNA glycosylase
MPELPEVETTRRGLERLIVGRTIANLLVRERRLRWPVARKVAAELRGQRIGAVGRRGKYLLVNVEHGALLVHLGMSGSLRYLAAPDAPRRHDHVDLCLVGGGCVRFNDPRRFGSLHFAADPLHHPLLENLGPEPLGAEFTADYLRATCRGRRVAIKQHLMNARVVVGVGNIYATEALFRAGIHPARTAGRISRARLALLVDCVRNVLAKAVERGGTTLRNYVGTDGRPGYFKLDLDAYDREGMPCKTCGAAIRRIVLGQRATFLCPRCQR